MLNERLKAILSQDFAAELAEFKRAHPGWESWDDEAKVVRLGLWLQERSARTPDERAQLAEDRLAAKRRLLLE